MNWNWVICPVRNNLHLTKKAIETFRAQDIEGGVSILVINNQSTDGTMDWLKTQKDISVLHAYPAMSVAESWNAGLKSILDTGRQDYCLVVNNDVELRPDTYRRLVEDGGGFVTAVGVRDAKLIQPDSLGFGPSDLTVARTPMYAAPDPAKKRPHPDFSCFLIRREVWEKVGQFDEGFKIAYAEDADYHVRMHKAGITAYCLDLPFLHHGAMTIKNSDPREIKKIQVQAEKNREYFKSKYGFVLASEEYYAFFGTSEPPTSA